MPILTIRDYIYLSVIAFLVALCLALGWFVHSYKSDYEDELQLNARLVQGVEIASKEALKDANKTEIIVKEITKRYEPQIQRIKDFKGDINATDSQNAYNLAITLID